MKVNIIFIKILQERKINKLFINRTILFEEINPEKQIYRRSLIGNRG